MNKYIKRCLGVGLLALVMSSCSDILDTESSRQNIEPDINQKTDSLFYINGIMEAMQQLADQYVFQGEMRGDLVATTQYTDSMLTQLANFSATTANRYDSAYVYYRVINNCNYYIAHRDTTLKTGKDNNVTIHEYAAVKAFRAWAYLQLARNYKRVPFFTEPLTEISQIDNNTFPELDMAGIVAQLAPDLAKFTGYSTPTIQASGNTIRTNWNLTKTPVPSKFYIPVDVVLGDMYLEVGNYHSAARHYVTYLTKVATSTDVQSEASRVMKKGTENEFDASLQGTSSPVSGSSWRNIFGNTISNEIISYIPMAPSAQYGRTSQVPLAFGADYYATPDEQTGYKRNSTENVAGASGRNGFWNYALPLVTNVQIVPSQDLVTLSDSTDYYYYGIPASASANMYSNASSFPIGDMRLRHVLSMLEESDKTTQWITKYDYANIILYRTSTVMLRLAEAFNRLGMCDVAFAILKDGLSEALLRDTTTATGTNYMTKESQALLTTTYPLLKDSFLNDKFPLADACGIHCHGASKAVSDMATSSYLKGSSPYTLKTIVGKKLKKLSDSTGKDKITFGATKQDTINALEDLICDEYALETAFEGNRYYDLLRLARHKNGHSGTQFDGSPAAYGANYGGRWLADKLKNKNAVVNLEDEQNWYLPFK